MDSSLKTRLLTALIWVPVIVLVLLGPAMLMTLAIIVASVIGLNEFFKAVGIADNKALCTIGYISAVIISIGHILPVQATLILVYLFVAALFAVMLSSGGKISLRDVAMLVLGVIYVPYFLSYILHTRAMDEGRFLIWFVFIGAFITDTCAYFTGCLIGKRKLCPSISPKKTVAGAVGGVIGAGFVFVIYGLIVNVFFGGFLDGKQFNLLLLFVLGLISAVAGEIGDLVASYIKRQYSIKDFSNILPGHGGILDRADSIILIAPLIYLFFNNIPVLG